MSYDPYEPEVGMEGTEMPAQTAVQHPEIDTYKLDRFKKRLREEQNLPLGIMGGFGAAVLGALIWAAITVITEYQIGWMAVGVGFLVGFAVRYFGKGIDQLFGVAGAGLALVGCLLGNFLAAIVIIAQVQAVPILEVFLFFVTAPTITIELMAATFSLIDLLFYGIAIYQGYKLSFRQVTAEELQSAMDAPF